MENNKKIIVPTIVAVATLVLLVVGATYAYFTVGSTNNFGTKDLNETVEDMADSVMLTQENDTLSLNVTREQMSEDNAYTGYYASGSAMPARIAKVSVAGEGIYKCDYKVTVTKSASSPENDLYEAYTNNSGYYEREIAFYLNYNEYDFADSNFPITYTDTMYNITKDTPKYITSNLEIVNQEFEQNYLKGKDITLTYSISDFECELSEPTGEYIDLAFNYEYMDDLGYYFNYLTLYSEAVLSLNEIVIPEIFQGKDGVWYKVTSIDNFSEFYMTGIYDIQLPDNIESIGELLFYEIETDTVKLPKSLISVGEALFADGGVKNIYIPKKLEEVAYGFLGAAKYGVENIYYEGSEAEWNALFSKYVGEGKDAETIIQYLFFESEDVIYDQYGFLPEIHFNVNY